MDQQYGLELLRENRELRQELEQYKKALRLACEHHQKRVADCIDPGRSGCIDYQDCVHCLINHFLTKTMPKEDDDD